MILYSGDKELFDFIYNITDDISQEISLSDSEKLIISDYSHNAVSLIRYALEMEKPVLAVLDGFKSLAEALSLEYFDTENCAEGKQELAILDVDSPIFKGAPHVIKICRGDECTIDESLMSSKLDAAARSEAGDIISFSYKSDFGQENIFALNFYIHSSLTEYGQTIIKNFINL